MATPGPADNTSSCIFSDEETEITELHACVCVQCMCMSSLSLSIKQNHALRSDDKINIISLFGVMMRSI